MTVFVVRITPTCGETGLIVMHRAKNRRNTVLGWCWL